MKWIEITVTDSHQKLIENLSLVSFHETVFENTEAVAYEFGAGRGLIQYQFPTGNQPDTEEDNIALGFITQKADAVLLRIESSNTQDYFELEIVSSPSTNSYSPLPLQSLDESYRLNF